MTTNTTELQVGSTVTFRENDEHPTSLGVVSRVWDNGKYVTIVSDGRMFVRLIDEMSSCRHWNVTGTFDEAGRHLQSACDDCGYTVGWFDPSLPDGSERAGRSGTAT